MPTVGSQVGEQFAQRVHSCSLFPLRDGLNPTTETKARDLRAWSSSQAPPSFKSCPHFVTKPLGSYHTFCPSGISSRFTRRIVLSVSSSAGLPTSVSPVLR